MIFRFVCLSVFVTGACAIVCTPEICMTVRCAAVTADNCNGVIKENGGFCGCCDACITELAEGDTCSSLLLMGVPSDTQCADGLYCDPSTHTCQKALVEVSRELGPCEEETQQIEETLASADHVIYGLEKPHCDEDGYYLGMQVRGSQAFCVTKNGTMIDGYSVYRWEAGDDMNCQCARDLYDYMQTGLIGKLFNCEPNGNYKPGGENIIA